MDLKALLNIGARGEAFIHIKLFPIIKKYFEISFLKPKEGGISISGYNNQQTGIIKRLFRLIY